MFEIPSGKVYDELRYGEAMRPAEDEIAAPNKHFFIGSYGCAMHFADNGVWQNVFVREGEKQHIKITLPAGLMIAEQLLNKKGG